MPLGSINTSIYANTCVNQRLWCVNTRSRVIRTVLLFFSLFKRKFMELLSDLRETFRLDSIKLNTITRKSLLRWSREVQFEERREKFYSASCNGKLKSRVSICQKKGKRPDWTVRLEMLKTPKIRVSIKSFLEDLGVYNMPKKKTWVLLQKRNTGNRFYFLMRRL